MKAMAWALLLCSAAAFAQNATEGEKPADGAIIRKDDPNSSPPAPTRGAERCKELAGTPLERCLEQERKASAGATRAPGEPPPQNPPQEKQ